MIVSPDWQKSARGIASSVISLSDELNKFVPQDSTTSPGAISAARVVSVLDQFQECVRYLNTRRSKGAVIDINGEDDLQDVIFLMLRPWIPDLVPENPTSKVASRYAIKDFISNQSNLVVESKYIRDKRHGKDITRELHDDIEVYRNHAQCKQLVFFIYDPDSLIPDVAALVRQIEVRREYQGKPLEVRIVVKP